MSEQKRKIPSIASLFPNLAWNILTLEQQQQLLEYLEKAYEWISVESTQKERKRKN